MDYAVGPSWEVAMARHVEGTFDVTSWNEEPAQGLEGTAKVVTARIGQRFTGGIEAETAFDTVMTYLDDGSAKYVGHHRVVGKIGDKSGTFVLQGIGTFDGKEVRTTLEVIEGSSTGDLTGIRGTGSWVAPIGSSGTFSLDYEL
jgi:Protein of unknown function (DUF3224)